MPKMRKDLNDPRVQEEIRQAEEVNRINSEIAAVLDSRSEEQKNAEWSLTGEEEEESRGR